MQIFKANIYDVQRQSSPYIAPDELAKKGQSGIVLAAVLILLGIIVALVLQAQVLARSYLNLEKARLTRTQLRETAGDGIWHALNMLAADQVLLVDHTNEEWAATIFMQYPNGIDAEIRIVDENRFIDANMLAYQSPAEQWRPSTAIIRDLLDSEKSPAGAGQALNPEMQAEIIRDWVDQNMEGAYEKAYYQRKEVQFYPANMPMESREELLWLLNVTTNETPRATALTILPAPERRVEPINVNTADRQTLLALFGGNNAPLVERIIRGRNAAPILALDQVLDPLTLKRYFSYLSVRSSFFSVHSKANMGLSTEEVYCLAKRDALGNIQIIRWVER
jgi:type II secretory pathway component PulK